MSSGSDDCIFCKIAAGAIPCAKIFETDTILAFLDINPVRPGHALVIPKAHYPTLWDIPAELGADLLASVQKVGKAVMEATSSRGLNLGMNNLKAAGQLVMHAHIHLIPRQDDDGLKLWPQAPYKDKEEVAKISDAIAQALKI